LFSSAQHVTSHPWHEWSMAPAHTNRIANPTVETTPLWSQKPVCVKNTALKLYFRPVPLVSDAELLEPTKTVVKFFSRRPPTVIRLTGIALLFGVFCNSVSKPTFWKLKRLHIILCHRDMYVLLYFETTKPKKVAKWKYYFRVWAASNILSSRDFSLRYAVPPIICGISNFTATHKAV